jgi:hypothetical protein
MNLKKTRDLHIAKSSIFYAPDGINAEGGIDHLKWVDYIDSRADYFIWSEHTEEGSDTLANIDKVPEWARECVLASLNKNVCYAKYDSQRERYNIVVANSTQRIGIVFEKTPTIDDLELFLDMANHLDAFLLSNGNEIIDRKTIEDLRRKRH